MWYKMLPRQIIFAFTSGFIIRFAGFNFIFPRMLKGNLLLLCFVLITAFAYGQSVNISVKDYRNEPLAGAIVQLINATTSERLYRSADNKGIAEFPKIAEGTYQLKITFIGFRPVDTSVSISPGHQEMEFKMTEDAVSVKEVVVVARGPLIRQEDDKMIIDVESMASISTNTLEVLESTPGLLVDQEGGIYLNSSTPAAIYINGREQKMSNQDIMTLLRSLPPGSVQRVEVIRTPSARYSASSSGGIINVILKRGVSIGRFGSVRTGMNQGIYGNRSIGFSYNNSNDVSTAYANFEYSYNDMLEELNSKRVLNPDTFLAQSATTRRQANQGYIGYGFSYDPGKKMIFSYDGRINGSLPKSDNLNKNIINTKSERLISESNNNTTNRSSFLSFRQELGAVYRIDTSDSEWNSKISYSFNRSEGKQNYRYGFILPPASDILGEGDNLNSGHFIQLQSDLTYLLPLKVKLETGIYSTWQFSDSRSDYQVTSGGVETNDPTRSKSYNYRERISSVYLQGSRNLGWKVLLKAGIRLEQTFMNGSQLIPSDTSFIVKRADLFPYLYISRPVFSIAGFELRAYAIYRKTISRPGYESLNPSVTYLDQFFYETGNPGLKPQFTENFEINISIDDTPLFAFGQNYIRDMFTTVIYADNRHPEIAYRTYDNLGKNRETYFRLVGGIPPTDKYFAYAGAQYNLNEYEGVYEDRELKYSRGSWQFFTYHTLKIFPATRITINAMFVTKGQLSLYELDNFGRINLGLNQTFFSKKLSVTFSARDILKTMTNNFRLYQGDISTYGSRYSDTRRFGINIVYNFGLPDKEEENFNFNPEE